MISQNDLKISFVMIVCNGDDFLEPCLECVYPHAYKICIAEGSTRNWAKAMNWLSPRSNDKTIDIIRNFPDPDHKIILRQQSDAYKEKDHQFKYALSAVPDESDYIWQIDADEMYLQNDINIIKNKLIKEKYTQVSFMMYNFFNKFNRITYHTQSPPGWGYNARVPRIFQYRPGYRFQTHRPPTIVNKKGKPLSSIKHLTASQTQKMGIYMYHYSYITKKQVKQKLRYYNRVFRGVIPDMMAWYRNVWTKWPSNPKNVENKYSLHPSQPYAKTKKFKGPHPYPMARRYNLTCE